MDKIEIKVKAYGKDMTYECPDIINTQELKELFRTIMLFLTFSNKSIEDVINE